MPDPRLQLSHQDLLYAAHALRHEAAFCDEQAVDPKHGSTREVFARSASSNRELADKFQQVAEAVAPRTGGKLPAIP